MKDRLKKIIDKIVGKDKFLKKRKEYLGQFKEYSNRNVYENIVVEGLYNLEFLNSQNSRYLGAIEVVLIMEGLLSNPGSEFLFKTEEKEFLNVKYKTKETYKDHIIRLGKEFLKLRNVL
jgi:hypothetical protein